MISVSSIQNFECSQSNYNTINLVSTKTNINYKTKKHIKQFLKYTCVQKTNRFPQFIT